MSNYMTALSALAALPIPTYTLAASVATTSFAFLANYSDYQHGVVAAVNGRLGPNYMDKKSKIQVLGGYMKSAVFWHVGSTVTAGVMSLTTAYLHPSPVISTLALTSGVFSLLVPPGTRLSPIYPYFMRILTLGTDSAKASEVTEQEYDDIARVWEKMHLIRVAACYFPAWLFAMAALMLDGRVA